ncbi:MAG: TlpA family protein disulfide reductase [Cyclobacteriaceae bacterium]|nr:TlpA family protein disulfide reductase [Cyclobacteriaceae bacterium]
MKFFTSLLKSILPVVIIVGLLKATGFMGEITYVAQSAAMKAGVLNVNPSEPEKETKFDYSFTIKDLKGNKFPFDQYKGKVVFINLWATWCGPCKAEMPGIQKLYAKMKDDSVTFIMLSLDKDQALPKVQAYVQKNEFTFPIFMPSGYLAEQLQVPSIPTTFIVSKEGKIVLKEVGTRNYDTKKMLDFLRKEAAK